MLTTIQGMYRDGRIELAEMPANVHEEMPVIVTFLTSGYVDLRARGIDETQAADLRARLTTNPKVGIKMTSSVLEVCEPADCVAVVCPMCHMNLDSYQGKVSQELGHALNIPILFLPQLMGLAFGLPEEKLMLKRHVTSTQPVLKKVK